MDRGRLEAFSDGVIAIIITIMVLNLKLPQGTDPAALIPLIPPLLSYMLSFIFVGIYWNNHHHLFKAVRHVDGKVLWANLHLLFWLSLSPFITGWMGASRFAPWPVAVYGIVLLCDAFAYYILTRALLAIHGPESVLVDALGRELKEKISLLCYAAAIPLAFVRYWVALSLYALVAVIWLVPDRRIEHRIMPQPGEDASRR